MLIGEYQHIVDAKGRVFIPARFREELGLRFIVSKGLDNCLFVYSIKEWALLEEKIRSLPLSKARNLQRFFFAGAAEVEADKQGRVLIPQSLRDYASLTKEVTIIGASNRVEIWDKQKWEDMCEGITPQSIAEAMDELGF
ncbi:MraZ protein [[Clostridium] cellulosi]|jgi:mraZ protein|uniref:Transcriptional regulator MraZ n=1 Tax=[Clostridium] cellulosi TaxID=29343 RepID=A0A078KL57_9FIRM|nr:MAG: transcriptional regulator MraZ [[Clostridium] cellulosi]CDZ24436.1 MraZ protein [[Clostridium] cellulosi]